MKRKICYVLMILFIVSPLAFGNGAQETQERVLPPGPEFGSMTTPSDSGSVKPVDMKSEKPLKIAVIGMENNPFFIDVKAGTLKAAEELAPLNCTVEWINAGESSTTEYIGGSIETAIVKKYDAIATLAGDSGLVPYINKAVEKGIPVATFNSETDTPNKRLFFVGADLYTQGQRAAANMVEVLGGKGKVGVITGSFDIEALELRRLGFEEYIEENASEIEIVGRVENNDQADQAYVLAQDFMVANPDLDALYVTGGGPFGAAKAVEDAGKAGVVKIICYDFVDETMEFVQSGVITGTIGQQPFAQGHDPAIRLYNYLVAGVVPSAGKMLTKADFVTKENIKDFWGK